MCLILFSLVPAKDVPSGQRDGQAPERVISDAAAQQTPSVDNGTQSALDVEKAWTQLRSIQNSDDRTARMKKKSGVLSATTYYAKKGLVLLFMNTPKHEEASSTAMEIRKLRKPLASAVRLLERAAKQKNPDAIYLLAEMSFYGNFTYPRNLKEAYQRYYELASLNGNSSAQHMVGFMSATGIDNAVERDQAKALLYHTFAARQGNVRSEMTMAFRHHAGIGTPRNCGESMKYYKRVADKAVEFARSGPPGGMSLTRNAYRIADEEGGAYGEGASYTSSGIHSHDQNPSSDRNAAFDDVMELMDLESRQGNVQATFSLGRLHYEGSRTTRRNFKLAKLYFTRVVRAYWTKEGKVRDERAIKTARVAAKAAAYLGRLHLRGEGEPQNFEKALKWFNLGNTLGDEFCQYEIGLMYLHGLGVRKDVLLAAKYFKESANQDWPASHVNLAKLYLDQGDLQHALTSLRLAERHGHIEALYHLGEINNNGVGRGRDCTQAVAYYKSVAEKTEVLHSSFIEANEAYADGDKETALIGYMMAAEQGYESAQANVAWILDQHKSIVPVDYFMPWAQRIPALLKDNVLALIYWTRSARQRNVDSMVKMGDYYFHGYGIKKDLEKAASCYESAQEVQNCAQAAWNLAWMHENGVGIDQDYHLAWRYYMMAWDISPESYLPVRLSLSKLYLRDWWNRVTGGKISPIEPEAGKLTLSLNQI